MNLRNTLPALLMGLLIGLVVAGQSAYASFSPTVIKTIQSGTITIASGATNTATITSVNTARSHVVNKGCYITSGVSTAADHAALLAYTTLTNATTVTLTRGSSGSAVTVCAFDVIEFL